jgi:hypothetical protein
MVDERERLVRDGCSVSGGGHHSMVVETSLVLL